jgi:hypothetical protein
MENEETRRKRIILNEKIDGRKNHAKYEPNS